MFLFLPNPQLPHIVITTNGTFINIERQVQLKYWNYIFLIEKIGSVIIYNGRRNTNTKSKRIFLKKIIKRIQFGKAYIHKNDKHK